MGESLAIDRNAMAATTIILPSQNSGNHKPLPFPPQYTRTGKGFYKSDSK
jgi:hypothetical protein